MTQNHERLNLNSLRKYPLHEITKDSLLGLDILVDANILINKDVQFPLYISSIYATPAVVSIVIKASDERVVGVACGTIADEDYNDLYIGSVFPGTTGVIVVGPGIRRFIQGNVGQKKEFIMAEGELETSTIVKTDGVYVKSITVNDLGVKLDGDVKIIVGDNVKVTSTGSDIYFELKNPLDFIPECYEKNDCEAAKCTPTVITSINSVVPDVGGNITLSGDGIVVPSQSGQSLKIDTPNIVTDDLCKNFTTGPQGKPGEPGPRGPQGGGGKVICGEADCICALCDVENIDDCDEIILGP